MLAKLLSWKIGGLAVLAATMAWASYGPDSILQNNIADNLRAWQAHGRWVELSDTHPLNGRYPVVVVLGLNVSEDVDGPSETKLKTMTALPLANFQSLYRDQTGRELYADTKWYGYWYNSDFADSQIGSWLDARIETDNDLTRANQKLSLVCHSKGGNVAFCYWAQTKGRKLDKGVTLDTPHLGTPLADKAKVEQAIRKVFPHLHDLWWGFLEPRLPSDTGGGQWLRTDCSEMLALRQQHPLTSDWFLIGSTIKPLAKNLMARNLGVALLASSKLPFGANQDRPVYTLGARMIEECGYERGSDGMVPLESAWCVGYAGDAHRIRVTDHDHSEMLQGNGGMELHRKVLECLLPEILRQRSSREESFDLWLPELPMVAMPRIQADGLERARLAWINENGGISVAHSQFANPRELCLPDGQYSWPQWMGNDILATWSHRSGDDIVLISDSRVVQLTDNGVSSLAAAEAGKIVFLSDGDLMIRTTDGAAKVLVCGPLSMEYPPVLMGDKVYFSVDNAAGGSDLRWVSTKVSEYPLTSTKLVERQVFHPMKIGQVLLAIRAGDDDSAVTVITGRWGTLRTTLAAGMKSLNEMLADGQVPLPTLIDMDSQENWLYLAIGGDIRQLDLVAIAQAVVGSNDSMTLDQAAVWRATATQFDVK